MMTNQYLIKDFDKLLFPLFDYLRINGVPLGVSEYLTAIRLLQEGFILDKDYLKRVCKLLWAKSLEDQELFDNGFLKYIQPQLEKEININQELGSSKKATNNEFTAPIESNKERKHSVNDLDYKLKEPTSPSHNIKKNPSINRPNTVYQLTHYLHLDQREMASSWKQLRQLKAEGVPEDLDIEATIKEICQTGFFLKPILKARRRNQLKLLVLIDQKGSMSPFSIIVNTLINSLLSSGSLNKMYFYYFHDCPGDFLYKNPQLTIPILTKDILEDYAKENSVLIISDAGAARNRYDKKRFETTETFLKNLSNFTYLYAWLNPLPSNRWKLTTAEDISCLVHMFPLTREGLDDIANVLRGHPFS